jgi:hypothetical protein
MIGNVANAGACLVLAVLLSACGSSVRLMYSGFQPLEPAPTFRDRFPEVRSLNPTLSWESFPGTHYEVRGSAIPKPQPFVDVDTAAVSNIRYDVIVWRARNPLYSPWYGGFGPAAALRAASGAAAYHSWEWVSVDSLSVVYERNGITGASHVVETALEPETEYAWSVRARFDLNGETRVSEWSLVALPNVSCLPGGFCGSSSRSVARQTGALPPYALYYFTTPKLSPAP